MILDLRSRPETGERSHRQTADRMAAERPDTVGGPAARLGVQIGTFLAIGIASTLAYLAIYAGVRMVAPPITANAVALLITAIGNTAANRRLTFGVRERESILRHYLAGLGAFAIALAITTGAVGLLALVAPRAGRPLELAVLLLANLAATVMRFSVLRAVIAPDGRGSLRPAIDGTEERPS
jgi:putative flippase GtrA